MESQNLTTTPNLWDKNFENYVLRTSIACLPIGVLACILNTIQICAIIQAKRQNHNKSLTNSTVFILNLAISDALIGSILSLYALNFIYLSLEKRLMITGRLLLHTVGTLLVSIVFLFFITMDRLYAVTRPIQYRTNNSRYSIYLCAFIWMLKLASIIISEMRYFGNHHIFAIFSQVLPIVLLLVMFVCYLVIWRKIKRSEYNVGKMDGRKRHSSKERNFTRLSSAIVVTFALCWLPFGINRLRVFIHASDMAVFTNYNLLEIQQRVGQMSPGELILTTFVQALVTLSAVTNPLLYFAILRGCCKKLWCSLCCRGENVKRDFPPPGLSKEKAKETTSSI
ncbi:probable G-protein coupled receptor 34 [Clytia hemisphaerica]|uniref:probable G-protein coupled receptor 34 n=1 Tax=Clytia hemisphaerica TaxID=252671 RepID=UPI0034D5E03A